jgi:uncharacterized membrane protein
MNWIRRHRLRQYVNDSVWIWPTVGVFAGIVTARLAHSFDAAVGFHINLEPEAARTVLNALASSMFTFVVFVSSALLIALQLASAQMTPRIIALVFRDPITRWAMTLFVYTFTLSVAVVLRIGTWVPGLAVYISSYGCVVSLVVFLYLIDHLGKMLRPGEALRTVAVLGRRVIEGVYPRSVSDIHRLRPMPANIAISDPTCSIPSRRDGVILACDIPQIVATAQRTGCVVELVPQVGDFVASGAPLFHVYGDATRVPAAALRQLVAIGHERSLEQDPLFAFRIIVDIACKALSPAINDPTTAVLAIDQLHHLLGKVGTRHLDDERLRDSSGQIRLLYRTPGWDDFVNLAVTEVRQFGCQSVQVSRRLHAMLESLIAILPEQRAPALRAQLDLLRRGASRFFAEPEDQVLAAGSDSQGVGGGLDARNGDRIGASPAVQAGQA